MVNCIGNRGASPDLFSLVKTFILVYNILTAPTGGISTFNPNIIIHTHRDRTADTEEMVLDAAHAMHLTKNETALLMYYCFQCGTGFAPSAEYLSKEIGVSRRTLYNLRNRLENNGILDIGKRYLYVNWHRLRQVAMADPVYTSRDYWDRYDQQKFHWNTEEILMFTTMPAEEQARRLDIMSEAEYQSFIHILHHFERNKDRLLQDLIIQDREEFLDWMDEAFGDRYAVPEPDNSVEIPGANDPVPF